MDVMMIANGGKTRFSLLGDSEAMNSNKIISNETRTLNQKGVPVNKGRVYTLVLKSDDVNAPGAFNVYLKKGSGHGEEVLKYKGREVKGAALYAPTRYYYFQWGIFSVFIAIYLLVILPYCCRLIRSRRTSEGEGADGRERRPNSTFTGPY
ncbi:MAG: hypothetical protein PUB39_01050 [Eubacteriales bacterium]|nr:hypothetical protein [Eubacteriales bacterium]